MERMKIIGVDIAQDNGMNFDDLYKAIELTDSDRLEDLIETLNDTYIQDISTLKKQIKHCKNPMERKILEKELNSAYKSRKRR